MDARGTGKLGKTCQRCFYFTACRHDKIGKLVNHQHNIWQEPMPFGRFQFAVVEFLIILLNIPDLGITKQIVPAVHLNVQWVKRADNFPGIGNNSFLTIG